MMSLGPGRLVEAAYGAGRIEKVGYGLNCSRGRVFVDRLDERIRNADRGNAPRTYAPQGHQLLECRSYYVDEEATRCSLVPAGGTVGDDLVVQEKEVNPLKLHPGEALVQALLE